MKTKIYLLIPLLMGLSAFSQNYMRLDASFYSPVLDEIKMIDIYLPKDYYINTEVSHPVIYYLHGAGGNQNEGLYCAGTYYGVHYSDTSITSPAAIVVCPDGSCPPYAGSMWLNSELYGNYEDYVVQDVVSFIEANFRVIPDKNFRFLHGVSMGGFGSGYLACKHPDMFRASCPSSGLFYAPDTLVDAWRQFLLDENGGFHLDYNAGNKTKLYFTVSGGLAPNMSVEPNYFESVFDTLGNRVDSVFAKWSDYFITDMVQNLEPEDNLAFFLICGTEDEFIFYPTNMAFADSLQKYGIDHDMAWYNGLHGVYEPVTHKKMFAWLDSLIEQSYTHLGTPEFQIPSASWRTKSQIVIYPNPFSEIVHLEYEIENPSHIELKIFNAVGEIVAVLQDGYLPKGKQRLDWNAVGFPSGLYFVRLIAGKESAGIKLIKQ
jgi:enterochelin esterase-like enzyme